MPHAQASGFPSPCVWLSNLITPVGQDRLILTRSGAGAPELQRWARCLPVGGTSLSRYAPNRDQEVSPTGDEASRPGGLSYGETIEI